MPEQHKPRDKAAESSPVHIEQIIATPSRCPLPLSWTILKLQPDYLLPHATTINTIEDYQDRMNSPSFHQPQSLNSSTEIHLPNNNSKPSLHNIERRRIIRFRILILMHTPSIKEQSEERPDKEA